MLRRLLCVVVLTSLVLVTEVFCQTVVVNREQLIGVWTLTQYELILTKTLTRTTQRKFKRASQTFDSTNTLLDHGNLEIRVELKEDGSYSYKQTADQRVEYYEHGSWSLKNGAIEAKSLTDNERSAIDGSRIVQCSSQSLVVILSVYKPREGIHQKIYYRRKT